MVLLLLERYVNSVIILFSELFMLCSRFIFVVIIEICLMKIESRDLDRKNFFCERS